MEAMIKKRDGRLVPLDERRIINAISKAYREVGVPVPGNLTSQTPLILGAAEGRTPKGEPISVEAIQDSVEERLVALGDWSVARAYVRYRYKREMTRNSNALVFTTVEEIIDGKNEEAYTENGNKNVDENSTIRDYIAGTVSRVYTDNFILPKRLSDAHKSGRTHHHDADYQIQRMTNCELVDLEGIFQNGTVINKTMIERPHGFLTACTIASQIDACVASLTFGGQTLSVAHLVPFVEESRKRFRQQVIDDCEENGISLTDAQIDKIVEKRVDKEIRDGVQTIHYQLNSLNTSNGQTPFVTLFCGLTELEPGRPREDGAKVFAEVFRQRMLGTKNENGVYVSPAFPKLIYELSELNCREGTPYWDLTVLAVKCTAKRMVPDYISAKKLYQWKYKGKLLQIEERRALWGDENLWGENPFKELTSEQCAVLDKYAVDMAEHLYEGAELGDVSEAERIIQGYNIPRNKVVPPVYPCMGKLMTAHVKSGERVMRCAA